MQKGIEKAFLSNINDRMPEVHLEAFLKLLQSPDVRQMKVLEFIREIEANEKMKAVIDCFSVEKLAAAIAVKHQTNNRDPGVLDEKITELLQARAGTWMAGRDLSQALKDEGSPQAVAARLRVMVERGLVRDNGERGSTRRYTSIKSEPGNSGGRAKQTEHPQKAAAETGAP